MNTEILKKIIAEWLEDKVFPPLVKRDAPDLVLERASEIIAVAGPRRAGKTCYESFEFLPNMSFPCKRESRKLLKILDSRLRGNDKGTLIS